jgi:hypothetical protein
MYLLTLHTYALTTPNQDIPFNKKPESDQGSMLKSHFWAILPFFRPKICNFMVMGFEEPKSPADAQWPDPETITLEERKWQCRDQKCRRRKN